MYQLYTIVVFSVHIVNTAENSDDIQFRDTRFLLSICISPSWKASRAIYSPLVPRPIPLSLHPSPSYSYPLPYSPFPLILTPLLILILLTHPHSPSSSLWPSTWLTSTYSFSHSSKAVINKVLHLQYISFLLPLPSLPFPSSASSFLVDRRYPVLSIFLSFGFWYLIYRDSLGVYVCYGGRGGEGRKGTDVWINRWDNGFWDWMFVTC